MGTLGDNIIILKFFLDKFDLSLKRIDRYFFINFSGSFILVGDKLYVPIYFRIHHYQVSLVITYSVHIAVSPGYHVNAWLSLFGMCP